MDSDRLLRILAILFSVAGTLFWLYTFYHISQLPDGDGTGFQWMAAMPLGAIFLAFIVPGFIMALRARTAWAAFALSLIGLMFFLLLWRQLLSEFAPG